jgi:peptide/nickel transport system permease protein
MIVEATALPARPARAMRMARQLAEVWRRLGLDGRIAALVLIFYVFLAAFGPSVAPYSPTEFDLSIILKPPSWSHVFGTDGFGRDVFSRILVGAQTILVLGTLATLFGVSAGCAIGLVAGYFGGWIDDLLMRLVDVLLALPGLLLALLIMTSLGASSANLVISIAIVFVPKSARVARGAVLPLRKQGFVDAARMRGSGWPTIVFKELLPNVADELMVELCLRFAYALLLISSLGFLGLGVQPPTPDWGLMIAESRNLISVAPWILIFPAFAIGGVVVAVNLLADRLARKGLLRANSYL